MQVTIIFNDELEKTVDIDFACELFYLYQKGATIAGEEINETRRARWQKVENSLKNAKDGDEIDFRLMGDIYYTNGGPYLDSSN